MKNKSKLIIGFLGGAAAAFALGSCGVYGGDYEVKFHTNGGTEVAPITVKFGETFAFPETTKKGNSLEGWYKDAALTDRFVEGTTVDVALDLYAKWTVNSYSVTFVTNGGSPVETYTGLYDSEVPAASMITSKAGWSFASWYKTSDFKEGTVWNSKVDSEDISVYAKWVSNVLTVKYDGNGGKAVEEMKASKITNEESAGHTLSKNVYFKEGYSFGGWSLTPNGEKVYDDEADVGLVSETKEIQLYAIWVANKYPLKFYQFDRQVIFETIQDVEYGSDIIYPIAEPSQEGYTFKGWGTYAPTQDIIFDGKKIYFSFDGTSYKTVSATEGAPVGEGVYEILPYTGKVPVNGMNFYGIYERNQYRIDIHANNDETIQPIVGYFGNSYSLPRVSKVGYEFAGWWTKDGTAGDYGTQLATNGTFSSNLDVYAKWTVSEFTLSFVANGGSPVDPITADYGSQIDEPTTLKLGYKFAGWYESPTFEGEQFFKEGKASMPLTKTLYAKWEADEVSYTVIHKGESLISGYDVLETEPCVGYTDSLTDAAYKTTFVGFEASGAEIVQKTIAADGSTVIELTYVRKLYKVTFMDGDKEVGSVENVKHGSMISIPSSVTKKGYEASYKVNDVAFDFATTAIEGNYVVDVTYEALENSVQYVDWNGTTTTEKYDTDEHVVITKAPTREGYEFLGWFDEQEGGKKITEFDMPAEGITLYAQYSINQYSYIFKDGDNTIATLTDDYQKNVDLAKLPEDPTKEGYTFDGWYDESENKVTFDANTKYVARDITLHSKYEANKLVVKFDANTGSGAEMSSVTYKTGESAANLPANTYTKTGHTFKGWALDAAATKADYADQAQLFNGLVEESDEITLYAVWEINNYTITYQWENGTLISLNSYDYGAEIPATEIPSPTKDTTEEYMYFFSGWYDVATGELYNFSTMPDKDLVLEARFEQKAYTVYMIVDGFKVREILSTDLKAYEDSIKALVSVEDDVAYYALSLTKEVEHVYNELNGYTYVYNALAQASLEQIDDITAICTYMGALYQGAISQDDLATAKGTLMALGIPENIATECATNMGMINFADLKNSELYLSLLAVANEQSMENLGYATIVDSVLLEGNREAMENYTNNAYRPYSDSGVFNGWKITYSNDSANPAANYEAIFEKAPQFDPLASAYASGIKTSSATFTWTVCEGAEKYQYSYVKNGDEANQVTGEVGLNMLTIEGLHFDDVIELSIFPVGANAKTDVFKAISVIDGESVIVCNSVDVVGNPLSMKYTHSSTQNVEVRTYGDYYYADTNGNFIMFESLEYSFAGYTLKEIRNLSVPNMAEISDGKLKVYLSGQFEFVLVNNSTGTESVRKAVVSPLIDKMTLDSSFFEYSEAVISGTGPKYAEPGYTYLGSGKEDFLIGQAIVSNTEIVKHYSQYHTVTNVDGGDVYYDNGIRFDFLVQTMSAKARYSDSFDFEYKFAKFNGSEFVMLDDAETEALAFHDDIKDPVTGENHDVFYFKQNNGLYKVIATPKADKYEATKDTVAVAGKIYYVEAGGKFERASVTEGQSLVGGVTYYELVYMNTGLPMAYKSKGYSVEFVFRLNEGINIYDNAGLKLAFADRNVHSINIQKDIKAQISASQALYVPYGKEKFEDDLAPDNADVNIVDGTAVMAKEADVPQDGELYGSAIWVRTADPNDASVVFHDVNGFGYAYGGPYENKEVNYYMINAKFESVYKSEFVDGKPYGLFDVSAHDIHGGSDETRAAYGYKLGTIYQRSATLAEEGVNGQDTDVANVGNSNLTINGNYFTIDGTDLPYLRSVNKVVLPGVPAEYEVQAINTAIFGIDTLSETVFNNLTIVSNTGNSSAALNNGSTGTKESIAQLMTRTSGGYNGIRVTPAGISTKEDYNSNPSVPEYDRSAVFTVNGSVWENQDKAHDIAAKAHLVLNNSNIYNTLIGLYITSCTCTTNYGVVNNCWANCVYGFSVNKFECNNTIISNSGGAAIGLPDSVYVLNMANRTGGNGAIDPSLTVSPYDSIIDNRITGEEQWFKAYGMEFMSLSLKGQIEQGVNAVGYSALQKETDPKTGSISEKMNFVFLGQTSNDDIQTQSAKTKEDGTHPDIGVGFNLFGIEQTGMPGLITMNGKYYNQVATKADKGADIYIEIASENPAIGYDAEAGKYTLNVYIETAPVEGSVLYVAGQIYLDAPTEGSINDALADAPHVDKLDTGYVYFENMLLGYYMYGVLEIYLK